jgi:hypothetical protein
MGSYSNSKLTLRGPNLREREIYYIQLWYDTPFFEWMRKYRNAEYKAADIEHSRYDFLA